MAAGALARIRQIWADIATKPSLAARKHAYAELAAIHISMSKDCLRMLIEGLTG